MPRLLPRKPRVWSTEMRGDKPLLWLRAAAGTGADGLALAGIRLR